VENAEELVVGLAPDDGAEGRKASDDETKPLRPGEVVRRMPRWVPISILVHLLFLSVAFAAAYAIHVDLAGLHEAASQQVGEAAGIGHRVEGLAADTKSLTGEVQNLRQFLVRSASEDVIFLKALILKPDIDPELARTVAKSVHRYAELYGKDANLILAMIAVESRFDPNAVSPKGAVGLMQVMPQWKKVLGITGDLSDPEVSIKYGLQILGFYDEMYRDLEMALTAYNRGPGPVDMALMHGQDPKNKYAPRVLEMYEKLKRLSVTTGI
jgi:hypothetical protein